MPIVRINLLEGRTPQQKRDLVADVTAAITGALSVKPDQVRILIVEIKAENFAVAGETAADKALARERSGITENRNVA